MKPSTATAYIGVGSNIDPEKNIEAALVKLIGHVEVTGCSTFYRTEPLDNRIQETYLNGVWRITTQKLPGELKHNVLKKIEHELCRVRTEDTYSSRTIDLDLLLYNDVCVNEPHLTIPDPDIYTRPFIAWPLMELDPGIIMPDTGRLISAVIVKLEKDSLHPDYTFTQRLQRRLAE